MPPPRRPSNRLRSRRNTGRRTGSSQIQEPVPEAADESQEAAEVDASASEAPADDGGGGTGSDGLAEEGPASDRVRSRRRTGASSGPLAPANRRATASRAPKPPRQIGLKTKFTLVMAGIMVVVLAGLGLSMASKANTYLFSQKQHDGIELAKFSAQLAATLVGEAQKSGNIDYAALQEHLERSLRQVTMWGADEGDRQTDLLAVRYQCPINHTGLSGAGYGPIEDQGLIKGDQYKKVFVPKTGREVTLPPSIEVYTGVRHSGNTDTPIYRFKVQLDPQVFGETRNLDALLDNSVPHVRVDINATSVDKALSNLFFAILLGVVVAIAIAIAAANYLARMITRPVTQLVEDMKIVAQGDLDHHTVPRSNDEIGTLASEFDRMTQSLKTAQAAVVEQEKAEYELSLAREVQRQLLPANPPEIPGFQCASFYQGAKAVSGDYFDFIDLGDNKWGFIIADVSGKGVPGSMVMAVTRTVIRLIAQKHTSDAHEALKETNRLMSKQIKRGMFVTAFYCVLDTTTGLLTYACAGHNPMVIYRAAASGYELAHGKGIALGFNEGPLFDRTIEVHQTVLESGDAIVMYTDGFPEAMNNDSEEFGDERFYQTVAKHGEGDVGSLISGLVSEVADHRGEADQSDDLTLLAVRRG